MRKIENKLFLITLFMILFFSLGINVSTASYGKDINDAQDNLFKAVENRNPVKVKKNDRGRS
jgi:hypothetical protein